MKYKLGDVVYIWPKLKVTIERIDVEEIHVVWFEDAGGDAPPGSWRGPFHRTIRDENKILGIAT